MPAEHEHQWSEVTKMGHLERHYRCVDCDETREEPFEPVCVYCALAFSTQAGLDEHLRLEHAD